MGYSNFEEGNLTNGHGKGAPLNNETRGARFPLSSSLPQAGERDKSMEQTETTGLYKGTFSLRRARYFSEERHDEMIAGHALYELPNNIAKY